MLTALLLGQEDQASSGIDWAFIVTSGGLLVAVLTLIFRESQARRDSLNSKVEVSVNGAIGQKLIEIQNLTDSAQGALDDSIAAAKSSAEEVGELVEGTKADIQRLESLLERASGILPEPDSEEDSLIPSALLLKLRNSTQGSAEQIGLARGMISNENATSRELELAGDAMKDAGSLNIASQLYEASIRKKEDNENATISKVFVDAQLGKIATGDASAKASEIILNRQTTPFQLREALNILTSLNAYDAMLEATTTALDMGTVAEQLRPILFRSRAVALDELNAPRAEIIEAFEAALEGSVSDIDYSNAARPYGSYLARVGEWELAREVVTTALDRDPSEAQLLIQLANIVKRDGAYERAAQLLALANENSDNHSEAYEAQRRSADLHKEMRARAVLQQIFDDEPLIELPPDQPDEDLRDHDQPHEGVHLT